MSYITIIKGEFICEPHCDKKQIKYLNNINKKNNKNYPEGECCWEISEDGKKLLWNGDTNCNYYEDWLEYLLENYFRVNKIILNGSIIWYGYDNYDVGKIIVKNNEIEIYDAEFRFIRKVDSDDESEYESDNNSNEKSSEESKGNDKEFIKSIVNNKILKEYSDYIDYSDDEYDDEDDDDSSFNY